MLSQKFVPITLSQILIIAAGFQSPKAHTHPQCSPEQSTPQHWGNFSSLPHKSNPAAQLHLRPLSLKWLHVEKVQFYLCTLNANDQVSRNQAEQNENEDDTEMLGKWNHFSKFCTANDRMKRCLLTLLVTKARISSRVSPTYSSYTSPSSDTVIYIYIQMHKKKYELKERDSIWGKNTH